MQKVAENIWIKHYPLNLLGGHQGRVVTVIRLQSGHLIIHSTAPFTRTDVADIHSLGEPGWIVDAMLRHDTYAKEGRSAFPNTPYLAPEGFAARAHIDCRPLCPAPTSWAPEVEVLMIDGMPDVKEHLFLHGPSRTLIVADLVFNFRPCTGWKSVMRRNIMGVKDHPDCARAYPLQVRDRPLYDRSIQRLMTWDFDRIIVGHCEVVERDGKELLKRALKNKGMFPAEISSN